ncbi:hypothetical protein JG687_00009326 [Phytophthora cactorum]|uniref:ZSWIM1/3 RNaseH-like domain-containing protein n=1 Tax=Phytophthora cactorum TaxID=29920 RepID=A0A8T1UBL0_9STRA|nr:hypothetical protein JG687_00009326 [Phytophthora cactorum]
MLMQDQFDVTCGIVIQTSVQKLCFEHWGQTLAMDWTHSTNNLGFHLENLNRKRRVKNAGEMLPLLYCSPLPVPRHRVLKKKTTRQAPFSTQSFGERSSAEVFCRHALQVNKL